MNKYKIIIKESIIFNMFKASILIDSVTFYGFDSTKKKAKECLLSKLKKENI